MKLQTKSILISTYYVKCLQMLKKKAPEIWRERGLKYEYLNKNNGSQHIKYLFNHFNH